VQAPDATPAQLMAMAVDGLTLNRTLYAAAKLGVADLLQEGAPTTVDLAGRLRVNEQALYRTLRYLASQGVFEEIAPRTFANNARSHYLCSDVPGSVRAMLIFRGSPYFFQPYAEILYSLETGLPGRSKAYGMDGFEYLRQHPDEARIFDDAMTNLSALAAPAIAAAYDFGAWDSITDVGGGNGMLFAAILSAHPGLRGILADQPAVLEHAQQRGLLGGALAARSAAAACDFFHAVPAGSRAYVMKNVIHDWDDDLARAILVNCRRAVPSDGVLLLVEYMLPEGNVPSAGKTIDLAMLLLTGGRERTVEEYRLLLADAGFHLNRVVPATAELMILEAIPAPAPAPG
jgi:hypothetical protein